MSTPKVSVVTVSFNDLGGLKQTVASVEAQTNKNYEHVVVDGGSTDGTKQWLEKAEPSTRWLSESDDGIADAMNKGVEQARGEWLLFLHAQDTFVDDSALETAIRRLDTDKDIVCFDVEVVEDHGSRIYAAKGLGRYTNFKTPIPHQGAFTRRSLFNEVGPFDTSLHIAMDYDFFLRAYRQDARADVISTVLTRMPATGISTRQDWASLSLRFREEREVHRKHCPGFGYLLVYTIYWPTYLTFRVMRHLIRRIRFQSGGAA
jgi:glycosyltransferase involved in cell wall biosynthesis